MKWDFNKIHGCLETNASHIGLLTPMINDTAVLSDNVHKMAVLLCVMYIIFGMVCVETVCKKNPMAVHEALRAQKPLPLRMRNRAVPGCA